MKPPVLSQLRGDLLCRPLWALLAFLLTSSTVWAEMNLPFTGQIKAPPQALPIKITAHQGEPVQVLLRCSGDVSLSPNFRIRTQPEFGILTEPKLAGKDSALVIYSPKPEMAATEDKFSYSVQSRDGVSLPQEVTIRFVDDPPLFIVTEQVDMGKVLLGESITKTFQLENRGGGIATGTLSIKGDFKMEGDSFYQVSRGEKKFVKVSFAPSFVGPTAGTINFSGHPDRETTLRGEGVGPIQAVPLSIRLSSLNGSRTGQLEILNNTGRLQQVEIRGDPRLKHPDHVEVPPRKKVSITFDVGRESPGAFAGEIELLVPGYSGKATVQVPALGPIFRVSPTRVQFGEVQSNQPALRTIVVENVGGLAGNATATLDPPFTLKSDQGGFHVEPDSKTEIQIGLQSGPEGLKSSTLRLSTSSGDFQIPLEAKIVNAPPPPSVPVESASAPVSLLPAAALPNASRQYYVQGKPIQITNVGVSDCELNWETVSATAFSLERRRLFLDEKGEIQSSWEPLDNVQISQQGSRMFAKLSKLIPQTPYMVRAVSVSTSGTMMERTAEATFITKPKQPWFTPMRLLLATLALLVGLAFKRWRQRE